MRRSESLAATKQASRHCRSIKRCCPLAGQFSCDARLKLGSDVMGLCCCGAVLVPGSWAPGGYTLARGGA